MGGNFPAGKREGRDRREGNLKISVPGDVPGEGRRSAGNPSGRQDTRLLLKNRNYY